MNLDKISKKTYSTIWALVLITPAYMVLFEVLFSVERSSFLMYMAGLIIIFLGIAIIIGKSIRCNKLILFIVLTMLVLFLFSCKNFSIVNYSIVQFGFYFLIPAYLVCQKFVFEDVFRFLIYFSLILIFGIDQIMQITNVGLVQADMYNTYAVVPCILAAMMHIIHYRKKSNVIIKLGYFLNLYYLLRISLNAVRGFWLVIIFFCAIEILHFFQKRNIKKTYYLITILSLLVILFLFINFETILTSIIIIVQKTINIEISVLVKISKLMQSGEFSNGRLNIWFDSIRCFINSPLWGHGIDGIQMWSNGRINYPHNFILQLLVDGGIIFAVIPITIVLCGLYHLLMGNLEDEEEIGFAVFLTSASIPISMLSGDIWKSSALWFTIFFYAKYVIKRKK